MKLNDKYQHLVEQLGAFLYHNSGEKWQTIMGGKGELISVLWPTRVPYTYHKEEKDEWEHVGNPKH